MMGSNNYLGLTHHPEVLAAAKEALDEFGSGCTGSRFLNGTLELHCRLEAELAEFFGKEACLVFSTGYQANLGLISGLVGRGDVVFLDKLDHASIVDGAKLSHGETVRFNHGDLAGLERKLQKVPVGTGVMIVVDGVFSMEGDIADVPGLLKVAQKYGAALAIDDAHAVGVLGPNGDGTAAHFGVAEDVDLIVGTFSKSLASIGGVVAASADIIDYLRHHSRPPMFTAPPPPAHTPPVRPPPPISWTLPCRPSAGWEKSWGSSERTGDRARHRRARSRALHRLSVRALSGRPALGPTAAHGRAHTALPREEPVLPARPGPVLHRPRQRPDRGADRRHPERRPHPGARRSGRVLRLLRKRERPDGGNRAVRRGRGLAPAPGARGPARADEPLHQRRVRSAGAGIRYPTYTDDVAQPLLLRRPASALRLREGQGSAGIREHDHATPRADRAGRHRDRATQGHHAAGPQHEALPSRGRARQSTLQRRVGEKLGVRAADRGGDRPSRHAAQAHRRPGPRVLRRTGGQGHRVRGGPARPERRTPAQPVGPHVPRHPQGPVACAQGEPPSYSAARRAAAVPLERRRRAAVPLDLDQGGRPWVHLGRGGLDPRGQRGDEQRRRTARLSALPHLPDLRQAPVKAFVTGGTGFVGAHLVQTLLARGAEGRCLVLNPAKGLGPGLRDVRLVRGDLDDAAP